MRLLYFISTIAMLASAPAWAGMKVDKTYQNVEIMAKAARTLKFSLPENRAHLLVKQETVRSPVATIFGYVDNAAACKQIAEALTGSLRVGTFRCSPIF